MTGGGVPDAVDRVQGDVRRGVIANSVVGTVDIVVDGAGEADDREAVFLPQVMRSVEGAVAPNRHQPFDPSLSQLLRCHRPAFGVEELLAARGLDDGAAKLDDVRDGGRVHLLELASQHTLVATMDADHPPPFMDRRANYRAKAGVHAWSIPAAGEDTDGVHGLGPRWAEVAALRISSTGRSPVRRGPGRARTAPRTAPTRGAPQHRSSTSPPTPG